MQNNEQSHSIGIVNQDYFHDENCEKKVMDAYLAEITKYFLGFFIIFTVGAAILFI